MGRRKKRASFDELVEVTRGGARAQLGVAGMGLGRAVTTSIRSGNPAQDLPTILGGGTLLVTGARVTDIAFEKRKRRKRR